MLNCLNITATDIGRTTALKENVFAIFVCILNKIPLFMIGVPGNSKNLAFTLIQKSMRGSQSKNPFIKLFPHLRTYYY